jgi:hypothetical protein
MKLRFAAAVAVGTALLDGAAISGAAVATATVGVARPVATPARANTGVVAARCKHRKHHRCILTWTDHGVGQGQGEGGTPCGHKKQPACPPTGRYRGSTRQNDPNTGRHPRITFTQRRGAIYGLRTLLVARCSNGDRLRVIERNFNVSLIKKKGDPRWRISGIAKHSSLHGVLRNRRVATGTVSVATRNPFRSGTCRGKARWRAARH